MAVDGKIQIGVEIDDKDLDKDLGGIEKKSSDSGDRMSTAIKGALAAVGVAAAAAVKELAEYTIKVGSELESTMSEVEAVSGASTSQMGELNEKAKDLGRTTKFSASEVGEGFKYMAMAGWDTSDMLDGIDGMLNLSAASGTDLATTSDIVTDALTGFGLEAKDSGHFADVLAAASSGANTNVGMMGETFKYAAPLAGAMGYNIEDMAIATGLMANAGIKGSQAGTTLRSAISNLASPTKEAQAMMDKYGISITNQDGSMKSLGGVMDNLRSNLGKLSTSEMTAAASTIFGKEAMSGMLAVITASDTDYKNLTQKIYGADGAAKAMAKTMNDNLKGKMDELGSAAEGLGIQIFDYIKGPMTSLVEFGADLLNGITDAITPQKDELTKFVDEISESNDEVQRMLDEAAQNVKNAGDEAEKLEAYKNVLLSVNEVEEKSEWQKYQIKTAVEALSGQIPELAAAYDSETGSINLTNEEIETLINNQERLVMQNALMETREQAYAALAQATLNATMAQSAYDESVDRFHQVAGENIDSFEDYVNTWLMADLNVQSADTSMNRAKDTLDDANATLEEAKQRVADTDAALEKMGITLGTETEKQEEASEAMDGTTESTDGLKTAQEELEGSLEATRLEMITYNGTTAEVSEETAAAWAAVQKSWDDAYTSAQNSISGQMGLLKEYKEGTALTTDDVILNMQKQNQAMTDWSSNMQVLAKAGVDEGILAELAKLGPEGYAQVQAFTDEVLKGTDEASGEINQEVKDKITELNATYEANLALQDITAQEVADMQVDLAESYEMLTGITSDFVDTMDSEFSGSQAAETITTEMSDVVTAVKSKEKSAEDTAKTVSNKMDEGIGSADMVGTIGGIFGGLIAVFTAGVPLALIAGTGVSTSLNAGLKTANTTKTAKDLSDNFISTISGQQNAAWNAGLALSNGITNGINAGITNVRAAASNSAAAALAAFRATAQIHSPSKAAEKDAEFVPEGWAGGIKENMDVLEDASDDAAEEMLRSFLESAENPWDHDMVTSIKSIPDQLAAGMAARYYNDNAQSPASYGDQMDYGRFADAVKGAVAGMAINMDGKRVGRITTPYTDAEMGTRSLLSDRGVV